MWITYTDLNSETLNIVDIGDGTNPTGAIENVLNPDFSEQYQSGGNGDEMRIRVQFPFAQTVNYVAIAGHNFAEASGPFLRLEIDGSEVETANFADGRNPVVFFIFDTTQAQEISLILQKNSSFKARLAYMAFGRAMEVPNGGEQSGYKRGYLVPGAEVRTQQGESGGPVAQIRQQVNHKLKLSVAAMPQFFAQTTWRDFLDYASQKPFFVRERDDEPRSSYLGTVEKFSPPQAHNLTRGLVKADLDFWAFTGV